MKASKSIRVLFVTLSAVYIDIIYRSYQKITSCYMVTISVKQKWIDKCSANNIAKIYYDAA